MDKYCVYILRCNDSSYYIGHTNDLQRRFAEHSDGMGALHTKITRPVKLVYVAWYSNRNDAFWVERQLKAWSKKKKEALIQKHWKLVSQYAKKHFF